MIYDRPGLPRITLEKSSEGFTAIVEVDGLEAYRDPTTIELDEGILSLDPPTVKAQTIRSLIELSQRAVGIVLHASTTDNPLGPGGLLMAYYRVAVAIRGALRELGEEI